MGSREWVEREIRTPSNSTLNDRSIRFMNNQLRLLAAAIAVASIATTVEAASTVNSNFTVSVNLSSRCIATNSGATTLDFGTYTAFQGSAQTPAAPVTLTFDCTRGLAPVSVAFDTTNGTAAGVGVLAGLQYALSTSAATTVAGTAASVTSIGTADGVSYSVSGSMPANQAGTCGTASCAASHTRTLIVSY
jgi:hypothetical protein